MASLSVLTFDHEGRPIQFDTWLDDLQLYLLSDSRDSVSFFDHTSGASLAPPATADSATRSQWLTRDAAARLAVRNHLPLPERAHFGQHKTAKALYDAVVARYSSPITAALGRLLLPYLFPELSNFAMVEDLVSHLRTSDAHYPAALPAEFLDRNPPPMDHFLALDPTDLTVDLLEQHLLAAETSVVTVGAAHGTPRTPYYEGCSPSPLAPSYASASAVDIHGTADVGAASALSGKRRNSKGKGGRSGGGGSGGGGGGGCGGGGGSGGGGSGGSGGGSGGFGGGGAGSGGGGGSGSSGSGGSRGGAVPRGGSGGGQRQHVGRLGVVLAARMSFARAERPRWAELLRSGVDIFALNYDAILAAMYALSVSAEGDYYLCVPPDPGIETAPLGASESVLTGTMPAKALHTFTLDSGASRCFFCDSTTLTALSAPVPVKVGDPSGGPVLARSSIVLPCPAVSASDPVAPPCSCRLLSHQTLLWNHRLGHPSLPRLRGMHSRLLVSGLPRSLPPLSPSPALPCLPCVEGRQHAAPHSSSFPSTTAPLQTLHMDVWGPACGEVPDVLIPWIHAVCLQLHEQFREDLPVLRLHSDRGAPHWLTHGGGSYLHDPCGCSPFSVADCGPFYHPTSRRVLSSQDVTFDESVPFYRLFPYHTSALPPHPLFLAPGPPLVDPLPPQGHAPSGVSQVDRVEPVKVAIDFGAAGGGATRGVASGGAEPAGVGPGGTKPACTEPGGAEPERAEPGGTELGGAEPERAEPGGADPECTELGGTLSSGGPLGALSRREPLSPQQLRKWFTWRTCRWSGAAGAGGSAAGGTGAPGPGDTGDAGAGGAAGVGAGGIGVGAAGGTEAAGSRSARTGGTGAAGAGGAAGVGVGGTGAGAAGGTGAAGPGGARAGDPGARDTGAGGAGPGGVGAVGAGSGGIGRPRPYFVPLLKQVLGLPSCTGLTPPLLCPPPDQTQSPLQPASPLPAPSPYTEQTGGLTERHEPMSRPASPVRTVRTGRRVPRQRPPPVPGTHHMALRPSSVPQRVSLPSPPAASLADGPDPESNLVRAASPTVSRLLANVVTNPSFESAAVAALVAELVDFAAACRLDYATCLVSESESDCPPSVGGECALGTDVLEDRQEDFECFAATVPHLVSMLITPEGDPDAPDIPTPRSYAEAITGPYSSQWQTAMDAEMASWKSTGTYVDAVPPPVANIVDGMWIFRVKRPPGSPSAFKARYIARGFSQRQGVDFFHTFSPTPKMTTLWVLLDVAAQRDCKLHSLDFSTAFLQGSLHEEIWLRHSPGFTGSSCEAEIYAGAMAAQELRWLTYLLTDLGERPRSSPVQYQRGQLRLAYMATRANSADIFTKALQSGSATGAGGAGRAIGSAGGATGAGGGGGFGFLRTAQRQQQSQQETFSPQVLSELFPQRCVTGSVEAAAPGASESSAALGASESAAALGASESAAALGACASPAPGPSLAEALHTFTLDSGASRCFFCDSTSLTPLDSSVPVSLADPTRGPIVARASTVLPCPAVPSGSLSGLHLLTFSMNLVSNAAIQDVWVHTFIPGGQRVAIFSLQRLARVGYSPTRLSSDTTASVTPPYRVSAVCTPVSLSLAFPGPCPPSRACLPRRAFPASRGGSAPLFTLPTTAPLQTLHMDVWGPAPVGGTDQESYFILFCRDEGIVLSFTLPTSPQQNGIAERCIGLIMEVARTSMIHASAPHFLWPFVVRYAVHQLNLWPRVSELETSPTLRWTGKVGDASVFRVWGALSHVRDAKANKLSSRTLRCVFLGFPTDALP
ncbi:unnamed protein product [Closterium sp. NIES-53]